MRDVDIGPKTVRKPLSFLKDSSNIRSDLGDEQELLLLGEIDSCSRCLPWRTGQLLQVFEGLQLRSWWDSNHCS